MKRLIVITAMALSAAIVWAEAPTTKSQKQTVDKFYVYTEQGSRENHFIPSGWMGDFGDLKMNLGWKEKPAAGITAMKFSYSGERKQGAGWAGIYWQMPANNWGDKRGGYDLSQYKKVTFMARGEKGGEHIDKFMVGGITGQTEEGDTDGGNTEEIDLTKDWKKYEISLVGLDMSHIIGGFGFAMNADMNPSGATFYVDDVVYEKK